MDSEKKLADYTKDHAGNPEKKQQRGLAQRRKGRKEAHKYEFILFSAFRSNGHFFIFTQVVIPAKAGIQDIFSIKTKTAGFPIEAIEGMTGWFFSACASIRDRLV